MAFPLTLTFMNQYRSAAAEGAVVELKMRMLADKTPGLQGYAHQEKLEDVESAITDYFGYILAESDKERLRICRQLRNKILHCDFSSAREKLKKLDVPTQRGDTKKLKVAGLSGAQIMERISGADVPGVFKFIADTKTKDPGNIYGWLLEMGMAGDFRLAAEAFKNAAEIVDRLFNSNMSADQ